MSQVVNSILRAISIALSIQSVHAVEQKNSCLGFADLAHTAFQQSLVKGRLEKNTFNTSRSLLTTSPNEIATTYQDNLSPGFTRRLDQLPKHARLLDSGSGSAKALYDLEATPWMKKIEELGAVVYSMDGVDPQYIQQLQKKLGNRFKFMQGALEDIRSVKPAYYNQILDNNGPSAYSLDS